MLFVRPIAADDWLEYRRIRLQALEESPQAFASTWEHEASLPNEDWSQRCRASTGGEYGRGFFAVSGNDICGLSWCLLSQDHAHMAHIYAMCTAPVVRGHGAGRMLLKHCLTWAQNKGLRHLQLSVTKGQTTAEQMYLSQGFYPVGQAVALHPNSPLKVQTMQLDF